MKNITYNQTVKEAIALALLQLMNQKPFAEITISEIVKIAGVGRSSFYRNFDNKEQVLSDYIQTLYHDFFSDKNVMSRMPKNADNTKDFLLPRFKFVKQNRNFFAIVRKHNLLYHVFEQMEPDLILLLTGQDESLSKYYRSMFSGSCAGIIRSWIDNNFVETEEEMVNIFTTFPR